MENGIFAFLGKDKVFTDNSNLTNLFDVQRLHENGKLIKCASDGVYTLFKNILAAPHCFIKMFDLQQWLIVREWTSVGL